MSTHAPATETSMPPTDTALFADYKEGAGNPEHSGEPVSDDRAEQSEDYVAKPRALGLHDAACKPAGERAYDKRDDEIH